MNQYDEIIELLNQLNSKFENLWFLLSFLVISLSCIFGAFVGYKLTMIFWDTLKEKDEKD